MKQLDFFLAFVLVVFALAVVNAQHRSRSIFIELENLKKEARELEEEWGKLQLEQGTLVNHARVELLARQQLGLMSPQLDKVILIDTGNRP